VARAREARKREERSRDRERMTRGRICQQEVELGARHRWRAAVARAAQSGKRRVPEEDEAERCQGDLSAIPKKFRDSSVN
jgi:hypothetical protein